MPTTSECIELVSIARRSGEDPASAYVLRARVKRSAMAVGVCLAERFGVQAPLLPDDLLRLTIQDPEAAGVLRSCTQMLARTRTLCQPSESLDDRWRRGWDDMVEHLNDIERRLRVLERAAGEA